jgi:hypothetical protein
MERIPHVIALLILPAALIWGQKAEPRYVDIDEARREIAQLESLNDEMADENVVLDRENGRLSEGITENEEFIRQANVILEKLRASDGELYTMQNTVVDAEMKRQLTERRENNRRQRYDLENRKREELELISVALDRIEDNKKRMAKNRVQTRVNERRIVYLNSCIELSLNEGVSLESVLSNAEEVRREVEILLGQE